MESKGPCQLKGRGACFCASVGIIAKASERLSFEDRDNPEVTGNQTFPCFQSEHAHTYHIINKIFAFINYR